jgi:diguanylate cyclase (GGDEF)-like protein
MAGTSGSPPAIEAVHAAMNRQDFNIFRSRLARQTFLLFVMSAILPVLFIAIFSFSHVSTQLREQSYEQSRQSSKTIAMELLRHLSLLGDDLETVAALMRINPADGANRLPDLPASRFADFAALAVFRDVRQPLPVRGTLEHIPQLTTQQREHLRLGKTLVTLLPGKQGEADILMIRMLDPDNPAGGLMVGRLSADSIRPLESLTPGDTSLQLFGPDNRVLYASTGADPAVGARLARLVTTAISGHFEWRSGATNHLASYWSLFTKSEFSLPYVVVVASQPEDDVLAPVAGFRTLYFPGLLLSILVVSLVSANRIRGKLAPLLTLRDATRRVAGGDFNSKVEVSSNDEIAELGNAFNTMTETLEMQFTSISAMAEIDRLILSSFDTRYIISTVLCRAGELTPCSVAAVLEFDKGGGGAALLSTRGNAPEGETREHQVPVSDEEIRQFQQHPHGMMFACDDRCPPWLDRLQEYRANRFLMLPTFVKQRLAAVLIFGYDAGHILHDDDREQLRKFADHVAVALSNASWEERLYHQAHYDSLTNLPNRALLKDRLEQAIARAQRSDASVGVMFVDLDRFKLVNDSLGHAAGDRLLQEVAGLLLHSVRSVDTVVRFGGDEFVLVIADIDRRNDVVAELGVIAGKILANAHEEIRLCDHTVQAEASIGIALYPKDGTTPDELVKHADTAMYHAKAQGRGCYRFFAPELNATATRRLNMEQELRRAMENNEFRVYYQPKFDCTTGLLSGAEALVRWQHPQKGIVPPDEYISLAEETGQIQQIGEWVLRSACRQIKMWRDAGLPAFRIAVNLSPRQFRDADISATVAQILRSCELDASALELEVTEGAVMENALDSIEKLKRLNSMGVRLSVDDFGTGYSSLNYLKTLPIHTLKIDHSFIVDMLADPRAEAIVSTIIVLAHNLGLDVVAEGVETEQQKLKLQKWHCDELQGFLFSPPIPADKFESLLEKCRRRDLGQSDPAGKNILTQR